MQIWIQIKQFILSKFHFAFNFAVIVLLIRSLFIFCHWVFIAFWYDNAVKWHYAVSIYFWLGRFFDSDSPSIALSFVFAGWFLKTHSKQLISIIWKWSLICPSKCKAHLPDECNWLQYNFPTDVIYFCQSNARPHINSAASSHDEQCRMINLLDSIK